MANIKSNHLVVISIIVLQYFVLCIAQLSTPALTTPSTLTTTTRPATAQTTTWVPSRACNLLTNAISICESETSNFLSLRTSEQSSCLCTLTGSIASTSVDFEEAASICSSYRLTAAPTYFPWTSFAGICAPLVSRTTTSNQTSTISSSETVRPTSNTAIPTSTGSIPPPTTGKGVQNLTTPQIAGVSVGCGCVGVLAGLAIYAGHQRRKTQRTRHASEISSNPPIKEK